MEEVNRRGGVRHSTAHILQVLREGPDDAALATYAKTGTQPLSTVSFLVLCPDNGFHMWPADCCVLTKAGYEWLWRRITADATPRSIEPIALQAALEKR